MKRVFFGLGLLLLAITSEAKPFRRVLVLTGGSLEVGTHLGVWSGLVESGWTPDLVITTCGSSMLSAFIQSEPNPAAVRAGLFSEEFYEAMRTSAVVQRSSGLAALWRVYLRDNPSHVPHVFGRTILDVPLASPMASLSKPFDAHHPAVLMVASRLSFGPEHQGKRWSRVGDGVLEEVFLTDDETAARIPPFVSPLAALSPRIAPKTEAIGGWDVWEAMRASISDPYLLAPFPVGDSYYATGAIDLVPVELALALGDDVMVTYTGRMGRANSRGFKNLFGFDQNKRGEVAREITHENLRWIDLSDDTDHYRENGISPVLGGFFRIVDNMPETYEGFVEKLQSQYDFASERSIEALSKAPGGDRSYIRKPW